MTILETIQKAGSPAQKGATIEQLCEELTELQQKIADLTTKAGELKQAIIEHCGVKDEGQQSFVIADKWRVTTKREHSRLVDQEQARKLSENLPADIFNEVFNYKPTLKLAYYRSIRDTNPDLARLIDTAIVSRPLPPRAYVELIENDDAEVVTP